MYRTLPLLLALAALLASGAALLSCGGGTASGTAAVIEVKPATITFPATAAGAEAVEAITVKNIGGKTLTITGLELKLTEGSADHMFLLDARNTPFDLEPDFAQQIDLMYAPSAGADPPKGMLYVRSTDEVFPEQTVQIDTQRQTGKMELNPNNLS